MFDTIDSKGTEETLLDTESVVDENLHTEDRLSPTSVLETRELDLESLYDKDKIATLLDSVTDSSARVELLELLTTARTQANTERAAIQCLNATVDKLKAEVTSIKNQKNKTVQNMRAKLATLQDAEKDLEQAKKNVSELHQSQRRLMEQNQKLRNGIQNITFSRDDMKIKLMNLKEVNKELRLSKTEMERKMAKVERDGKNTEELLKKYRELAIHTGYHHFGKQIRMLESSLAAENDD